MLIAFHDYFIQYWKNIVLVILILGILILLISLLYYTFFYKVKTFKKDLIDTKTIQMSVTIDLEERIVEKYYLYDQNRKYEKISLDEFYVRFDSTNTKKLRKWLNNIALRPDFNKTRRIELVMYNADNKRDIYLVELEGYNAENKRYFLNFKDISDSVDVMRRVEKVAILNEKEDFFDKVNEKLSVTDNGSSNFLVSIKYKEQKYALKELQGDMIKLIDDSIHKKIKEHKSDNEFIFLSNDSFYLFAFNISNVKKFKKHIRNMMFACSGQYSILQNKFNYTITLVAGYTKINKDEKLSLDKTLEADTAVNTLLSKGRFADRVQLFDDNLRTAYNLRSNKLLAVEKVVTETLFSLNYVPIISTEEKKVSGYSVQVGLPHALNMQVSEFISLLKQRYFRLTFYTKVFELIAKHKDAKNKPFYISFDFDDLDRVMEAYKAHDSFAEMNFYFCIEFSNNTLRNNDLIAIERKLSLYKENYKVKFGITYNTLSTIYLNAKIYSKADVVLLTGQLIENALDTYSNESLLRVYTKVASEYAQEVIGLNIQSLAIYELLTHYKVKKVGGIFLTPYVHQDCISDKLLLKKLEEIDNRTY